MPLLPRSAGEAPCGVAFDAGRGGLEGAVRGGRLPACGSGVAASDPAAGSPTGLAAVRAGSAPSAAVEGLAACLSSTLVSGSRLKAAGRVSWRDDNRRALSHRPQAMPRAAAADTAQTSLNVSEAPPPAPVRDAGSEDAPAARGRDGAGAGSAVLLAK